jgi:hypothetical protein
MAASEAGRPNVASLVLDLSAEPDAAQWARVCAWVPGSGHCRNRGCSEACIFHSQREAEADRVQRWRRLRRALGLGRRVSRG